MHSIPQLNFSQIPNVVYDYWMQRLKPTEFMVLSCLCRKIFGWHKTSDTISLNQLIKATNLSKNSILAAIKELVSHGLVTKIQSMGEFGCMPNEFKLNVVIPQDEIYTDKSLEQLKQEKRWGEIIKVEENDQILGGGSAKDEPHVVQNLNYPLVQNLHPQKKDLIKQKEIKIRPNPKVVSRVSQSTSDNICSVTIPPTPKGGVSEQSSDVTSFFYESLKSLNPKLKKPDLNKWAIEIDRMMRIDERSEEEIRTVIKYVIHQHDNPSSDGFRWSNNVLSPEKLRKHFAQLWALATQKSAPAKTKKTLRQAVEEMGFKHGEFYNQAECFISDSEIAFQRGMTHQYVKFSEKGFWDQFENIARKLGIKWK